MRHLNNALITWRITEMLIEERGPYAIFDKLRDYSTNQANESKLPFWSEVQQALECRFCLSVWVGFVVAIATQEPILYGFAYSAAALLFGRVFERFA